MHTLITEEKGLRYLSFALSSYDFGGCKELREGKQFKLFGIRVVRFILYFLKILPKISQISPLVRLFDFFFSEFAENLFKKGVSWPLIISLLAFSGSLAAECTRNGRSILVRRICDWATLFIVMRLKEWIKENGGWVSIIHL